MEEKKNKKIEKTTDKKSLFGVVLLVIGIILIVCGIYLTIVNSSKSSGNNNDVGGSNTDKVDISTDEKKSSYRMSGNSLDAFDLYFLQLENNPVNKVYSPLSIKYALNMLSDGSNGNSKVQIDSIVGDYKANKYTNSKNMSFANAMFIKNTFSDSVKLDYKDTLVNKYNADVIYDSFETPDTLNTWVSDKTFNLVNNLFDDVSANNFVLVNALAIDMEWNKMIQATTKNYRDAYSVSYKHEKFSTYVPVIDGDHYGSVKFNDSINAKAVQIGAAVNNYDIVEVLGEENIRKTVGDEYTKWLAQGGCGNDPDVNTYLDSYIKEIDSNYKRVDASTDFTFYYDEEVNVFSKDLKEYDGTTLQYVGIMPKNISLDKYIENIDAKKVNTIINSLKEVKSESFDDGVITKVTGYIPLFKLEYELDLMEDLKQLGITDIFDIDKADLSGITSTEAFIDTALHKANIEFSNEGIKAAAATGMGGAGAAGCWFTYDYEVPVKEVNLTFDKPFLFLIRDKNSGEVWFAGTVYEPIINN